MLPTGLAAYNFQVVTSSDHLKAGTNCAIIKRLPGKHYGEIEGSLHQSIDATSYREKTIKLRAFVKVQARNWNDQAYLWLRIRKKGSRYQNVIFYENMADRPIKSKEWVDYELSAVVTEEAVTIEYGLSFVGDGQAYLDAVSLEVINKQ